MIQGLMMHEQLTISQLLDHAAENHGERQIACFAGAQTVRYNYATLRDRVSRLVGVLRRLGVSPGNRVASLAWNSHRHLELYFAVPALGAVLNTINVRLPAAHVKFILEHSSSKLLFHDATVRELALDAIGQLGSSQIQRIVMGEITGTTDKALDYEALLASESGDAWADVDERAAAMLCYTSGTTGDPKGVLFSHRSTVLHALNGCLADAFGISARDVVMPVVPMFHANCWGMPFMCAMTGAKQVMIGQDMAAKRLVDIAQTEGVTFSAGVPTVWLAVRDELVASGRELKALNRVIVAGSAMPPSLMADLEKRGTSALQAFGMTEVGPLSAVARLKPVHDELGDDERLSAKLSQGRVLPGTRWRIMDDDGRPVPRDGSTPGELHYRGAFVASGYFQNPDATRAAITADGWLRSGDVCTIDKLGYVRIVDRAKDLVKSGGEWISSIDLENTIMGHPGVAEAAVIAADHPKWIERPLAVVVRRPGTDVDEESLKAWLSERCPKWWLPDRVVFREALPRTGTAKFSKRELRKIYAGIYSS
jgi:Acyl-CoA synthetases (AMP-forming)/AMP-acid ligases II